MRPLALAAFAVAVVAASACGAEDVWRTAISHAAWLSGPTTDQINAAWPETAKAAGVSGGAVLDCAVGPQGALSDCRVVQQRPPVFNFGAAALPLASQIVLRPADRPTGPGRRKVIIKFELDEDGPVNTEADWLHQPSLTDLEGVYPAHAHANGARVILKCVITVQGGARDCTVLWESPERQGFGAAALLLAPSFQFKPATRARRPVATHEQVSILWQGDFSEGRVNYRMTANLLWIAAPSSADVAKAYPSGARIAGRPGHAVLRCGLASDGALRDCNAISEAPLGAGFGDAALKLSKLFKTNVAAVPDKTRLSVRVDLPFIFAPPSNDTAPRMLDSFQWTKELNPEAVLAAFPVKAAEAGLKTGRAVVECVVLPNGALSACQATSEDPAGQDFGPSAIEIAQVLAVNPWTDDGLPSDGAHVRFAVRFVREEPPPAAPSSAPH